MHFHLRAQGSGREDAEAFTTSSGNFFLISNPHFLKVQIISFVFLAPGDCHVWLPVDFSAFSRSYPGADHMWGQVCASMSVSVLINRLSSTPFDSSGHHMTPHWWMHVWWHLTPVGNQQGSVVWLEKFLRDKECNLQVIKGEESTVHSFQSLPAVHLSAAPASLMSPGWFLHHQDTWAPHGRYTELNFPLRLLLTQSRSILWLCPALQFGSMYAHSN